MRAEKKELNIQIGKRLQTARENNGYTQEAFYMKSIRLIRLICLQARKTIRLMWNCFWQIAAEKKEMNLLIVCLHICENL